MKLEFMHPRSTRLAVMQPYPFPYIGYFELMARVDRWVALDIVQYTKLSWMNRNRIQHPEHGWHYFTLPVKKAPHTTPVNEIRLADLEASKHKLLAQLQHYRRHAPHYGQVVDLVRDAFSRVDSDRLVDFNLASLRASAERLDIATALEPCSRLGLDLGGIEHAGQWSLRIAQQLGVDSYLNLPGGRGIFRPEEWKAAGVELAFTEMNDLVYDCAPYVFEPNLSILDVLMWNDADDIRDWLRKRSGDDDHIHVGEKVA
ncbi:MAG: WbqC family protein [Azoarcus sp.]|nr:WbqC family protein [Azoarcus sp.]